MTVLTRAVYVDGKLHLPGDETPRAVKFSGATAEVSPEDFFAESDPFARAGSQKARRRKARTARKASANKSSATREKAEPPAEK